MLALVLGAAACVHDDAERLLSRADPDVVIAVNDMIAAWHGPIDHAVTLHPEKLPVWLRARAALQPDRPLVWTHWGARSQGRLAEIPDHFVDDWKGSSGLLGVTVARQIGCTRIVLAGVPMDSQPHVPGLSSGVWRGAPWPARQIDHYRAAWTLRAADLSPFVRSMSGWTMELFGAPGPAWLAAS